MTKECKEYFSGIFYEKDLGLDAYMIDKEELNEAYRYLIEKGRNLNHPFFVEYKIK